MIDPKLNEIIPEDTAKLKEKQGIDGRDHTGGTNGATGLSINDTIAGEASLSSGSRGVDTSGVSAGAGVGAGMTHTTASTGSESPAPQIVPGARTSGTTVRGASNTMAPAEAMPSTDTESAVPTDEDYLPTSDEISSHAYRCWHERGCPDGSPEEDWHRAEQELRRRKSIGASA